MSRIYKELSNPTIENTLKKKKGKIFEQKLYQGRYRMTNKHMKRCLFNIIIKIARCPCIPITMTKSKYLTTSSVSKGAEHLELPCITVAEFKPKPWPRTPGSRSWVLVPPTLKKW